MQVGRYELLEQLGQGGQGGVFRAQDVQSGQVVAVKVLEALSRKQKHRVDVEVRTMARLSHPNLVRFLEWGETPEGYTWIAQDFVEGKSLGHLLRRGALPLEQTLELIRKLGQGLQAAHENGIVHRDVKPDNVMFRGDGTPVLIDFGMALDTGDSRERMTRTGTSLGTPGYWSPEQALGKKDLICPASDVYALAALLYACLAGRPPINEKSLTAYAQALAEGKIDSLTELRPGLPPKLWDLCRDSLARDPKARPQDAGQFVARLEALRAQRQSAVGVVLPYVLLAAVATSVVGGALWSMLGPEDEPTQVASEPQTPEAEAPPVDEAIPPSPPTSDPESEPEPDPEPDSLSRIELEQALLAAKVHVTEKRFAEALLALAPVLETDPGHGLAWCVKGEALVGQVEYAAAIEALTRAIELRPGLERAHFLRAECHVHEQSWLLAEADYSAAIEANPENAEAYLQRAAVRRYRDDAAGALSDYSRTIRLDPDRHEAYSGRSALSYASRDYAAALEDIEHALKLLPSSEYFARRGNLHLQLRNFEESKRDLDRAISVQPDRLEWWVSRGQAKRFLGLSQDAVDDFDTALAGGAEDMNTVLRRSALQHRGQMLLVLGDDDRAREDLSAIADGDVYAALFVAGLGDDTWVRQHAKLDDDDWRYQLCRWWVGKLSEADLRALASGSGDAAAGRCCEVEFYLGSKRQLGGDIPTAIERYRACIRYEQTDYVEDQVARARLERLSAGR